MPGGARPRRNNSFRSLFFECLETRQLLSATTGDASAATPDEIVADTLGSSQVGFSPSQILNAYGFNQLSFGSTPADGSGETIAIVDAYNNPYLRSDLQKFDTRYGIAAPPSLQIVNQTGGSTLPRLSVGWGSEIALDVELVHAIAPGANILLVEANSTASADLDAAEDYARNAPGVVVISNSWSNPEYSNESSEDSHFVTPAGHSGVTFVAAAGDDGLGAQYPAASPDVLTVGGTSLTLSSDGGYGSESAWSNGGGGASLYEPKPSYQLGITPGTNRTTPDVSAVADQATGIEVYSSFVGGWEDAGGTSAATPIWAAPDRDRRSRVARWLAKDRWPAQAALYSMPRSDFHDITTGSNGAAATGGYDLATGLGSPIANLLIPDLVNYGASSPIVFSNAPANSPSSTGNQNTTVTGLTTGGVGGIVGASSAGSAGGTSAAASPIVGGVPGSGTSAAGSAASDEPGESATADGGAPVIAINSDPNPYENRPGVITLFPVSGLKEAGPGGLVLSTSVPSEIYAFLQNEMNGVQSSQSSANSTVGATPAMTANAGNPSGQSLGQQFAAALAAFGFPARTSSPAVEQGSEASSDTSLDGADTSLAGVHGNVSAGPPLEE